MADQNKRFDQLFLSKESKFFEILLENRTDCLCELEIAWKFF
jgi:hypothetical protein